MNVKINVTMCPIENGKREAMIRAICKNHNSDDVGRSVAGGRLEAGYLFVEDDDTVVGFMPDSDDGLEYFNDCDSPEMSADDYLRGAIKYEPVLDARARSHSKYNQQLGRALRPPSKPRVYEPVLDARTNCRDQYMSGLPIEAVVNADLLSEPQFKIVDDMRSQMAQTMAGKCNQMLANWTEVDDTDTQDQPTTDATIPATALCMPKMPNR